MRKNILVVDDDAFFRRMMIKTLVALDAEFTFCVDGPECLEVIESNLFDYDLILMDVHMTDMLGSEATGRIRAMAGNPLRRVPIIALTGDATWCDAERCAGAGFTGYMAKPNDLQTLYDDVDTLITTVTDDPITTKAVHLN